MHPQQRTRFVESIVQELGSLTANFELFGYRIMDRYHPAKWDHRGTNIAGFPVKSTLDSVVGTVEGAAEYSSEKNYFADPQLTKLKRDLDHIVNTHSQVKLAWALSSCAATGGEMTKARQVATTYAGVNVEVLDARRIADFIVDNLHDQGFIGSLAAFVPFLARLRDEWALSHQIPKVGGYVPRTNDETKVLEALDSRRVVVITGISGIGKSTLCSRVAHEVEGKGDYEMVLWQDAAQLTSVEQLRSVYVDANGDRENLLGYLKQRKCLLVLDNLVVDDLPRNVVNASGPGTKVLATSQVTTHEGDAVALEFVEESLARAILSEDLTPCPDPIFEQVYRCVGGHPLILSILNTVVADGGGDWSVAQSLDTSDLITLTDTARRKFCVRLLEQHQHSVAKEVAFVAWLDAALLDVGLLRFACGPFSERELRRRHFISGEAYGTVRVNDLVFESIVEISQQSDAFEREFVDLLAQYVEQVLEAERAEKLPLLRAVRIHRELIERLLRNSARLNERALAALRYAYAIARDASTNPALLGDPIHDAEELASARYDSTTTIRVRSVVEAIEATFSILKMQKGENAAVTRHKELLPAFNRLLQTPHLPSELRVEVELHRAKALAWARDKGLAMTAFEGLVALNPGMMAARVQMGRLLAERANGAPGRDSDAAVEQFEAIMAGKPNEVAVTVSLAAFDFLRNVSQDAAVDSVRRHRERLLSDLARAVAARLEQPFKVVANLGTKLWYVASDIFEELFALLSNWPIPTTDDSTLFAWAQAQKQAAKSLDASGKSGSVPLFRHAVTTYEQVKRLDDRQRAQFAECLARAGEGQRAVDLLNAVQGDRTAHWHHRMAEASRAAGDLQSAQAQIEVAIATNEDEKYKAAFLREKWLIRSTSGDTEAIEDLREAHRRCEEGRFKEQLAEELRKLGDDPSNGAAAT